MKIFCFKIAVALLGFSVGFAGVRAADAAVTFAAPVLDSIFRALAKSSKKEEAETFPRSASGKIELRLRRVYQEGNRQIAEFALVNGTAEPVSYMGYGKNSYCTITYRVGESLKTVHGCTCGTGLELQTLPAGDTALYRVPHTFHGEFPLGRQKISAASFGFEVMVGAEQRREQLWTEVVTFP